VRRELKCARFCQWALSNFEDLRRCDVRLQTPEKQVEKFIAGTLTSYIITKSCKAPLVSYDRAKAILTLFGGSFAQIKVRRLYQKV
jgi:hypothetical protein